MSVAPLEPSEAQKLAVQNIAKWGDTDVFPFAPENHILHDRPSDVISALAEIDLDLDRAMVANPPIIEGALSLVTYEGFRWVTQLDPLWNSYFLSTVLQVAAQIEDARIEVDRKTVFSYRFQPDSTNASLFASSAWHDFSEATQEIAQEYEYVAVCDIADFYGRIYHHRIENSLKLLPRSGAVPSKVNKLLSTFSGGVSYGLPVGGPAARMLSELLLNRTDRLLSAHKIRFCRFADDYRLFAHTREDAFRNLVLLTQILLRNEGLALQRHKTRVVATKDFLRSPLFMPEESDELTPMERQERRLLRLSIRYDPYSITAEEDYDRLKSDIEQFDILGMLTAEVSKSRVNTPVVKRLAQVVKLLEPDVRDAAADMLVTNLDVLAPALPVVLRVLEDVYPDLSPQLQAFIPREIRRRIQDEYYWITVPINLSYALRVLQHDRAEENIALCTTLFDSSPPFIQRDIVYLMHHWGADFWLSDKRRQWVGQHSWVKRALMLASFSLGDEGSHWRRSVGNQFGSFDIIANSWMSDRRKANQSDLPL
jgi:hypothetical protein